MKEKRAGKGWFLILNTLVPLVLGLLVYLVFRPDTYIAGLIGRAIRLSEWNTARVPGWLSAFLRNYASDILWAYSLAFALLGAAGPGGKGRKAASVTGVCVVTGTELLQKAGVLQGTFDIADIALEALFICLATFIHRQHEEEQK